MMTLKPLVFFGTEDFSLPSFKALADAGWPIKAVVTKPDSAKGRGRKVSSPKIVELAKKHGISVLQPNQLKDIEAELSNLGCELAVLVAYGKIIPASVIELFRLGIVNVHPSLLPKYRGPAPIEAAILNGDSKTGVSIMKLSPAMDAGPVYKQIEMPLSGQETKPALYTQLATAGAGLLAANLALIASGQLAPNPQNQDLATYTKLLTKNDGNISWQEEAASIEKKVRAFLGFPKTKAIINDIEVILLEVRVASDANDGNLVISCRNSFLEILALRTPNGRQMSGAEFRRGYIK